MKSLSSAGKKFLFFFTLGPCLLLAGESRTYQYLAKDLPVMGTNCHEQAKNLALKFTALTQLPSTARCYAVTKEGVDILISYQASEPLQVVSSSAEIGFPSQGYEFSTKEQCEREISTEVESFKTLTGMEPLLAFCRSKENYYGRVRWALVVEGFGKTSLRIAWASSLFPGQPNREQVQRIKKEVQSELSNDAVQVRHVFLQDDDHGHLRLNVNYYGKYDEQIQAFSLSAVNTLSQCEEALNEMEELKSKSPNVKTLSYCVNNPYRRGVDLVSVIDVTRWHRLRQSAELFTTYEECHSAKPALLEVYKSSYPEKILGGFCTEWGSNWKINLIEEKPSSNP